MKVFVSGKISGKTLIEQLNNNHDGIKSAVAVLKLGHEPFCAWTDCQFQLLDKTITMDDYYRYSMAWLKVSDCVLALPNYKDSKGAKAEVKLAKELKIPVYYNLEDLPLAKRTKTKEVT